MATHILILEDEPEIRELFNFSLTRAGRRVTNAESGESALQQLFQLPGLVIADRFQVWAASTLPSAFKSTK